MALARELLIHSYADLSTQTKAGGLIVEGTILLCAYA
jgi:hypothetical protein